MSESPGQYGQPTPRAFAGNIPGSNKSEEQAVEIGDLLEDIWAVWITNNSKGVPPALLFP